MPWGRHRLLSGFLIQVWENFGWRLWAFRLSVYRSHRHKCGESSQNCQWSLTKYHFGDHWQVRPHVWNMPANSNWRLEHVVDLCEVWGWVAHRWTQATVCVCMPGTVGLNPERQNFPLEGHNRTWNLGFLWTRNQTAVLLMEKPEGSKASYVKNQENFDGLF
jgi:hypothetical protein